MLYSVLILYLLIMNTAGFISMGDDKARARQHCWRIPEAVLIGIAAAGGSIGSYIGMQIFRHKTKHPKFTFGIPLIIAVQAILVCFLLIR